MKNLDRSLEGFLQDSRILIGNSQGIPGVAQKLGEYGYTRDRLSEGLVLLDSAVDLVARQRKEYGDQYEATAEAQAAWDEADQAYMKTLKIARVVFVDDVQAIASLKLAGGRKASMAGWVDQAVVFYGNLTAQPELTARMGRFGYTPAKLASEKALVDLVVARCQAQAQETGEAQRATVARDTAVKALDHWVGELRTVLKVAMADDPEGLEVVGITVGAAARPKKKVVAPAV